MTSAYAPLAGIIVRESLMDELLDSPVGGFTHGATWGGHPMCTAVAYANITAMRDEHVLEHVRELAPYFRAQLDQLMERHRIVKEVRGAGYFYGIELVVDRDAGRELTDEGKAAVCREVLPGLLQRAGLMTRADDRGPAMLMLSPPLVADQAEIDELLGMVDTVLGGAAAWMGAPGM